VGRVVDFRRQRRHYLGSQHLVVELHRHLGERLPLGQALGGLILLAVATNLPEIAITCGAATSGNLDVAVSNILGGIAIQTLVLLALDAFGVRERRPLTYQAARLPRSSRAPSFSLSWSWW